MSDQVPNNTPPAEQPAPPSAGASAGAAKTAQGGAEDLADQALAAAQAAIEGLAGDQPVSSGSPSPFKLNDLAAGQSGAIPEGISLLSDVNLNVKIELGRTRMLVEDVLRLSSGAVVELDKLAGDPVDIYVNDRLVARGEVLVLNDNFCVRVNEIIAIPTDSAAPRKTA